LAEGKVGFQNKKTFDEVSKKLDSIVYVRYLDHVIFSRCEPLIMRPQTRETVGWLNYECEDYIVLSWDRDAEPPTLKGGGLKASGLVLLRTAILEFEKLQVQVLPLQQKSECHLNSPSEIVEDEYALRPTERKTHSSKGEKTK
jgi:hypothetical protein